MKFGLDLPNMRECSDPKLLAEIAREAEDAGWDGVFLFDSLAMDSWGEGGVPPHADPWIALAAIAAATSRVRFGPMIAPLSRRRPWKVARETVTLDHLSNGRMILPVGLGTPEDGGYQGVGEELDRKTRAELLDESLEIITGLWSGEHFAFDGEHYQIKELRFEPKPVQEPRIPIWVVGAWPRSKSMRRAVRYDGILPIVLPPGTKAEPAQDVAEAARLIKETGVSLDITPEQVAEIRDYAREHRGSDAPFDIVLEGNTSASRSQLAAETLAKYEEAGATWYLEGVFSWLFLPPHDVERMRERIRKGPPRPD